MDWFRKKKNADNSQTLRDSLFTAIRQGDSDKFVALCNKHGSSIFEHFDKWKRPPEAIRQTPEEMNAWAHCLVTIAKAFESAGYPELFASLTGDTGDNPITGWTNAFANAHQMSEIGRYKESNATLLQILDEMKQTMGGSAVDRYRPKIYGLLGSNYFRMEDFGKAKRYTDLALADCERTGDREGVSVYTDTLATLLAADSNSQAAHCRKTIAKAQDFSDELQQERSNGLLREVIKEIEKNPELRFYRAKVYGLMGSNYYHLDDMQHAREYTELAIKICKAEGDDKGVRIYKENLNAISK